MEINKAAKSSESIIRYQKARKEAREIRDFYINLSFFCLCIPVVIGINLYFVPEYHWFWFSVIGWGSGLLFHGLSAFKANPFALNNWQDRKIQEFIKDDLKNENSNTDLKFRKMERITTTEEIKLERVKKRVKELKGFYKHLAVYLIVNGVLLIINYLQLEPGENFFRFATFSTLFFWGIGLLFHAVNVFAKNIFLGSDWEEKKISEFMNQETKQKSNWE